MTAVNQESVWSSIQFETGTFGKQPEDVRKYIFRLCSKNAKKDGMEVYLLEYTKDEKLIRRIKQYCRKISFIIIYRIRSNWTNKHVSFMIVRGGV